MFFYFFLDEFWSLSSLASTLSKSFPTRSVCFYFHFVWTRNCSTISTNCLWTRMTPLSPVQNFSRFVVDSPGSECFTDLVSSPFGSFGKWHDPIYGSTGSEPPNPWIPSAMAMAMSIYRNFDISAVSIWWRKYLDGHLSLLLVVADNIEFVKSSLLVNLQWKWLWSWWGWLE